MEPERALKLSTKSFTKEAINKGRFNKKELKKLQKAVKKVSSDEQIRDADFEAVVNDMFPESKGSNVDYEKLFQHIDYDGSGTVSFKELVVWMSVYVKGSDEDKLKALFEALDVDDSGFLEEDEIKEVLDILKFNLEKNGRLSESGSVKEAHRMVVALDGDADGKISLAEWLRIGAEVNLVENILGKEFLSIMNSYTVKGDGCCLS